MIIDSIVNGIVLDHITAGKSMEVYKALGLDDMDCTVAMLQNVKSVKMGKKDIIKIADNLELNLDVLGFIDSNITVSYIRDGKTIEKKKLELPKRIKNVIHCHNPRCITSVEEDIEHEFYLADEKEGIYRCIYCESKYKG